jgi:hypothetical protein
MGGTPTGWRQLDQDARADTAWKAVYTSMDGIQPWTVGRYADQAGADGYRKNSLAPDLARANADGNAYLPVVFPGFSWKNLNAGPANQIPRRGGRFLWRQAMNAKSAGAQSLKIAMFDEVDEGTAIFKLAAAPADAPDQGFWLTLDADGEALPSDWYLRVAGQIAKVFHGETPATDSLPIRPSDPIAIRTSGGPRPGDRPDGPLRGTLKGPDLFAPDGREAGGKPVGSGVFFPRPAATGKTAAKEAPVRALPRGESD